MTLVVMKDDTRIPTRSPAAVQPSKSLFQSTAPPTSSPDQTGASLVEAISIMTEVPQEEEQDKQPIIIGVTITVASLLLLFTGLSILHLRKLRKNSRSKSDEVTVAADPDTSNRSGEQRIPSVRSARQSSRAGLSKSLTSDKPTSRHRQDDRLAKSLPPEFEPAISASQRDVDWRSSRLEQRRSARQNSRAGLSKSLTSGKPISRHRQDEGLARSLPPELKPAISASQRDVDWRSSQMRRTSIEEDDIETGRRSIGVRKGNTGVSKSFTTRDHRKRSLRHDYPNNLVKSLPPRFELSSEDAGNTRTGRGEIRSKTLSKSLTTEGRVPRKDRAATTNTTYNRLQTYPPQNPKAPYSTRNNSRNATSLRRSCSHNKVTFEQDEADEHIEWMFGKLRRSTSSKNVRSSSANNTKRTESILRNSGTGILSKSMTTERSNRNVDLSSTKIGIYYYEEVLFFFFDSSVFFLSQ